MIHLDENVLNEIVDVVDGRPDGNLRWAVAELRNGYRIQLDEVPAAETYEMRIRDPNGNSLGPETHPQIFKNDDVLPDLDPVAVHDYFAIVARLKVGPLP